jgi:hypothetical protein
MTNYSPDVVVCMTADGEGYKVVDNLALNTHKTAYDKIAQQVWRVFFSGRSTQLHLCTHNHTHKRHHHHPPPPQPCNNTTAAPQVFMLGDEVLFFDPATAQVLAVIDNDELATFGAAAAAAAPKLMLQRGVVAGNGALNAVVVDATGQVGGSVGPAWGGVSVLCACVHVCACVPVFLLLCLLSVSTHTHAAYGQQDWLFSRQLHRDRPRGGFGGGGCCCWSCGWCWHRW